MKQTSLFASAPHGGDVPQAPASREQLRSRARSRRRWATRAYSVSVARLPKGEIERERRQLALLEAEEPLGPIERPRTRGECANGPRPCPFVSCAHHLYLDVSPRTGSLKLNRPELDPWELTESCSLDVADRGGMSLEGVGAIMNVTRERVRQIERKALVHLRVLASSLDPA